MLPNTENRFPDYFLLQSQTPGFHFPYENSFSPAFILHSKFDLHQTKRSLTLSILFSCFQSGNSSRVHRSSHSETSLFFPCQHLMAEWPHLFLHFFLLFFLPHVSHQVTVNASTKALTFVHDISEKDEFNSSLYLACWPNVLVFSTANFLLPSACPDTLNVKSH